VDLAHPRRGDRLFWKGHVAIGTIPVPLDSGSPRK
jgi:hypothetical protein